MDASKAICAAAGHDGPAWDLVLDNSLVTDALPLMTVNTIAATGSEYDNSAVISNIETNEKLPLASDLLWPVVSFIDPAYTITVLARQTVAGSCDTMSHFMEQYFVKDISPVAEGLIEGILRTVIRNTPVVRLQRHRCSRLSGLGLALPRHRARGERQVRHHARHRSGVPHAEASALFP